jgi:hypothetical protein
MNLPAAPKEILLSQLLALHLDLSLKRYKGTTGMSKFSELADFTTETMADWDGQAAELLAEGLKLKARGAAVLQKHRDKQAEARSGFAKMEEAVRRLEGDNAAPNEKGATDSAGSSSSFQASTHSG